ncbi:MAG: type II secretion system F family protein [Patescibacteria group bacterium]|nr:type II secretion system F family protein [Patescibacteria group bacterium]MDE1945624.1 type II secretion system F family protein [Patescibacteria group bacterium]
MNFRYKSLDQQGKSQDGVIDAINIEVAISALQKRGLSIVTIKPEEEGATLFSNISFFDRISTKDVVILSRQMATLFAAQVSALRIFQLLAMQSEKDVLRRKLKDVADDLQAGDSISGALAKHPDVFSDFYVNMVRAGEESGKLDQTFMYLADHLDRSYAVTSKVETALIYPAFVVLTFIAVMALMLVVVIPKIGAILKDSGTPIPAYTQIVLGLSSFFTSYGWIVLVALVIGGFFVVRYFRTPVGAYEFDEIKLSAPVAKNLYQKLYLSRVADNLNTMIISGIPMVKGLEITSTVVGSLVYEKILKRVVDDVKAGSSVSDTLGRHPEMPGMFVQMAKIGEETGKLGDILKTLSVFYEREVTNEIDGLVSLIEPAMIVLLGVGVGFLMAAVLVPIYSMNAGV